MNLTTRRDILSTLALICVALLVILFAAQPVNAQTNTAVTFETVGVDIWPEYDQPAVLVMYNITIASQVKLPATITLRIPASAGQPHAVANRDGNRLFDLQYQTIPAGEWTQITFTTSLPGIRLEYYDPSLNKQGAQRNYAYQWPADYAVNRLVVQVQQPGNAINMRIDPNAVGDVDAESGLTYFHVDAGSIPDGDAYTVSINYNKPDDTLTSATSFQPVQPNQPLNDATQGRITINEILPWLLGGLGVLLIGSGVWWYMRTGQATVPARTRHASRRAQNPTAPGSMEAGKQDAAYCHQCGKRSGAGDVFCRTCGTKLK